MGRERSFQTLRAERLLTKKRLQKLGKTKTQLQIAKQYGVTASVVRTLQRKHGLDTITEYSKKNPKGNPAYKRIDLDQFNQIDNEDLAYVLGYLAWAGSFYSDSGYFSVSVSPKNVDTLEVLKSKLGLDRPIYRVDVGRGYTSYRISISQVGLKKAFKKWYYRGSKLDPKKFPPKMPQKFIPAYLMGYFERHGHVGPDCHNVRLSVPSREVARQLRKCLRAYKINSDYVFTKYDYQRNSHRINIKSRDMVSFFNLVYGNWDIGTSRKNRLMIAVEHQLMRQNKQKGNLGKFNQKLKLLNGRKSYPLELTY